MEPVHKKIKTEGSLISSIAEGFLNNILRIFSVSSHSLPLNSTTIPEPKLSVDSFVNGPINSNSALENNTISVNSLQPEKLTTLEMLRSQVTDVANNNNNNNNNNNLK